jgi:hypothetical protein
MNRAVQLYMYRCVYVQDMHACNATAIFHRLESAIDRAFVGCMKRHLRIVALHANIHDLRAL